MSDLQTAEKLLNEKCKSAFCDHAGIVWNESFTLTFQLRERWLAFHFAWMQNYNLINSAVETLVFLRKDLIDRGEVNSDGVVEVGIGNGNWIRLNEVLEMAKKQGYLS